MNEQNNHKNFFKTFIVPLIFVGLYLVIQYVGGYTGVLLTQGNLDTVNLAHPALASFLGQAISLLAMIAILVPYLKRRKHNDPATVMTEPMTRDSVLQGILWGFVGIGVMILTNIFLQPYFLALFPTDEAEAATTVVGALPLGLILLNYLNSAILAPIAEELTFRHGVLGALKPQLKTRRFLPYLYSAVLFAATHLDITQVLAPIFLGLLLAHVYVKTRTIGPAIIAHGIINALMGATLLVLPEDLFGMYLLVLSGLALVAVIILMIQGFKNKKSEKLDPELA